MMAAQQRRVCPACGDTRVIRYGDSSVACPMHDGPVEPMDSAASKQIRQNVIDAARRRPSPEISPEPADWQAIAANHGRGWRALGGVLMCCSAIVVIVVVLILVVLW